MTKKTAQEVADCLNQVLDSTAKLNGQTRRTTRRLEVSQVQNTPSSKWMQRVQDGTKTFKKPSQKGQTWRQRNQEKQVNFKTKINSQQLSGYFCHRSIIKNKHDA